MVKMRERCVKGETTPSFHRNKLRHKTLKAR